MANFSRKTIIGSLDTFERMGHSEISRFLLEHGLEDVGRPPGSKQQRAVEVGAYLVKESGLLDEDDRDLVDVIVEANILRAINTCTSSGSFLYQEFRKAYPTLHRGLERDGFTVESGHLQRALPVALDLPKADDEVHTLLAHYDFVTARGHLDQAIEAHARGHWAAANGQLRTFIEGLLDEIAELLNGGALALPPKGRRRQQWLAQLNPPFFIKELNEWTGKGTGFLEGFYQRLHPEGSHPGLSDEDDSTFRLHLVLLTSRLLLTRLQQRVEDF